MFSYKLNMDLKSFANQKQSNETAQKTVGGMSENDVRRAIKHFSGMSNDQLMQQLSKHISAKKRAGKEAEIYGILERIKPLLNDEQRNRLAEIMRNME